MCILIGTVCFSGEKKKTTERYVIHPAFIGNVNNLF